MTRKFGWSILAIIGMAALLAAIVQNYVVADAFRAPAQYRFAKVGRADLQVTTISTGRIEPIDADEVSSQLSGQIIAVHAKHNDRVTAGEPLAKIDDKAFQASVAEAQAKLAHAEASLNSAIAVTVGADARHEEASKDFARKRALSANGNISNREVEIARAKLLSAESALSAARATETVHSAAIDMAAASLRRAEINLERTVIRSPIDGTVMRRSVEMGQTVAVSMEAPTLFTIAQDLSEVRVHIRVDEADIGQIRVGQGASFTVDAFPHRTFDGEIVEIQRSPEMVENVVTYTVVATAPNRDLALLPGMTALVRISVLERPQALLVPNAALRFDPGIENAAGAANPSISEGRPGHVWVEATNGLSRIEIGIDASDGGMTEVVSGPLQVDQLVAIGTEAVGGERRLFGLRLERQ